MEDRDDADAGAQVLGVGCDCECGVGRCLHEQVIDHGLVLIGDVAELGRQGINHMKILDRQQFGLALGEPPAGGGALTLWAVAVATTVVGDGRVSAALVLAPCNVSAAVRQRSIADITFNWSRLTWPRLASRQAEPWSRRISATSRPDRAMRAPLPRLGTTALLP